MSLARYLERTPLPVDGDPFQPVSAGTSAGWWPDFTAPLTATRGGFPEAAWAIAAALSPTAALRPALRQISREAAVCLSATRASTEAIAPLLGFPVSDPSQALGGIAVPDARRSPSERVLDTVRDLTGWLGFTEEQVADAAGYSRRSISNWRKGIDPYPKTVRGLFELHALVDGLVRAIGLNGTQGWLAAVSSSGEQRMRLIDSQEGRAQLLREAQPLLFVRVESEQPAPNFEEPVVQPSADSVAAARGLAHIPPRRRHRPG